MVLGLLLLGVSFLEPFEFPFQSVSLKELFPLALDSGHLAPDVVLRFGAYSSTADPGLRWHIPWPAERVELVNINEISPFNKQTRMLTADEKAKTAML